jgi:hypothetical protein
MFLSFLRREEVSLERSLEFLGRSPKFCEKSVLFYPQENYESSLMDISQDLQPLKFTTIANIEETNIFACSELKLINSPFHYKFKRGIVDQRIHFNCFRFLGGTAAASCSNSPVIAVKLTNNYNYEVRVCIRLDWNNTFGLNEVDVELSVNDHVLTTQKIKQCETKVLAVIIAKHQIPSDGIVNLKFTSQQLYTEKDLGMSDKDLKTGLSFVECSISPIRNCSTDV